MRCYSSRLFAPNHISLLPSQKIEHPCVTATNKPLNALTRRSAIHSLFQSKLESAEISAKIIVNYKSCVACVAIQSKTLH